MQIHVDIFWFYKVLNQVFELKFVSVYTRCLIYERKQNNQFEMHYYCVQCLNNTYLNKHIMMM